MEFVFKTVVKFILYFLAAWFMLNDAKNRDTSGVLWAVTALVLWIWGFFHMTAWVIFPVFIILYLLLRPKGELVYCTECFKKKLIDKPYCPHCFYIDDSVIEEELSGDASPAPGDREGQPVDPSPADSSSADDTENDKESDVSADDKDAPEAEESADGDDETDSDKNIK